ncbi:hypothetical protein NC651_021964 [Populus alba x Populus x berolinensis]|nr:hypothetical protein NC651_021964 [Populus alba x Populus x berolinensis]
MASELQPPVTGSQDDGLFPVALKGLLLPFHSREHSVSAAFCLAPVRIYSRSEIYVCNIFDDIATETYINPASPIKAANATGPITTDAGSSIPFTPPTPNLADPLSVAQSQLQTPASQQHTSPQKDTFHDSCHRQ